MRTFPATDGRFAEVDRLDIAYDRVEVKVATAPGAESQTLIVDHQPRLLVLPNATRDVVVGQYPVPIGEVSQVRIYPTAVTLHLRDGSSVALEPGTPSLPSWANTGWKIGSENGQTFPVLLDELTGVRALFRFPDRLVRAGKKPATDWKVKPTVPAERFQVNPPPDGPGVFFDQLTVVFREGTSRGRIAEINAGLRATVLISPRLTTWYRVKLPATTNLELAAPYYRAQPEVLAVLPAVNFVGLSTDADDDDDNVSRLDRVGVRDAWDTGTGNHAVEVAIVDTGVDYAHADLYRNIAINQGELPPGLFDTDGDGTIEASEIATVDLDPPGAPDGRITIRDLELAPAGSAIVPPDANGNGRIDGFDLIMDPTWANGVNEDGNGVTTTDPNGFVDDLIGWNFIDDNNDPTAVGGHGTVCAGIIGAEGNNGQGIAGINWRASIVPLRASVGGNFLPDVNFAEAVRYIESRSIGVANISQGWHFGREGVDYQCGDKNVQTTSGIDGATFDQGLADANAAYTDLFGSTNALYVFAAGNSSDNVDTGGLLMLPQEAALDADPERVLIVGATGGGTAKVGFSNFGQTRVSLYAPGENWVSLAVGGGTSGDHDGTSFSAPTVTGAAVLLAATRPAFRGNAAGIRRAIIETADPLVGVSCGGASHTGLLLNANAMIARTTP